MICGHCGAQNKSSARACIRCGKPLGDAGESAARESDRTAAADKEQVDAAAMRAAIGDSRTAYYMGRFAQFERGAGRMSWNWAAFCVTFGWLLYRKLWLWALGYLIVPALLTWLLGTALATIAPAQIVVAAAGGVFLVATFVFPPLFANWIYYRSVRARIEREASATSAPDAQLARLREHGGTSTASLLLAIVLGAIPGAGFFAAVALPVYLDMSVRNQVAEGLLIAAPARAAVEETMLRTGEVPLNRVQAGLSPDPEDSGGRFVSRLDVVGGRIDIYYAPEAAAALSGNTLSITPYLGEASDGQVFVVWRCGNAPVPAEAVYEVAGHAPTAIPPQYLPGLCRP